MKSAERIYVELIYGASNKYAAWDPEIEVKVGDYGRITSGKKGLVFWRRRQGVFLRFGNIYDDDKMAKKHNIPVPKIQGSSASRGVAWVISENAQETEFSADVSACVTRVFCTHSRLCYLLPSSQTPVLLNSSVKASFKFTNGRGAILAMDRDIITTIDPPGSFRRLLEDMPDVQDKVIISEVHSCSSYARYLGAPTVKNVTIGLSIEPPAGVVASAKTDIRWVRSTNVGNFKTGVNEDGERSYHPLFRLVSLAEDDLTTGLRGGAEEVMQMPLADAPPPWMTASTGGVPEAGKAYGTLKNMMHRLSVK